jgi:hypothetical protein
MQEFSLALQPQELSPSDVGNIIYDYFHKIKENDETPTVAGLALVLNLTPSKIFDYANVNIDAVKEGEQQKAQIIARALAYISEYYETGGDTKKNSTFNWNMLKALGYPEKTTVDHTIDGLSLAELAQEAKKIREEEQKNKEILSSEIIIEPIEGEIIDDDEETDEENQ